MDEFLELLKETAVFMLAGQMILHFLPGKKYAKYGKMIVGLLVLSQLVLPVLSLGQQDGSRIFLEKMGDWEADQELFSRKMEKLEEKEGTFLEHALLESVEEQLKNQADTAGVEVTEVRLKKDGTLLIEVMQQNNPKKQTVWQR